GRCERAGGWGGGGGVDGPAAQTVADRHLALRFPFVRRLPAIRLRPPGAAFRPNAHRVRGAELVAAARIGSTTLRRTPVAAPVHRCPAPPPGSVRGGPGPGLVPARRGIAADRPPGATRV